MKERSRLMIGRRALLSAATSVGIAAGAAKVPALAGAERPASRDEKRKARYQPDSAEVQTFYRVNRYPPRR
jgi:hypothetical protein